MPTLTDAIRYREAAVEVIIGVSDRMEQELAQKGLPIPTPLTVSGVIDTGAFITCVDPKVCAPLALTSVNTMSLQPAYYMAPTVADVVEIRLTIVHPSRNPADHLVCVRWEAAEYPITATGHDVLIGADLLDECDFRYNGRAGWFSLDY